MIEGVLLTPLKRICHDKGDILHGLKNTDEGFEGFGEAYFSSVHKGYIKGWKKHSHMVMNLVVPFGMVRFVIHDDRAGSVSLGEFREYVIGEDNYCRLTVPAGIWLAFQGVSSQPNWLLNIASIPHDPDEAINLPLEDILFDWVNSNHD